MTLKKRAKMVVLPIYTYCFSAVLVAVAVIVAQGSLIFGQAHLYTFQHGLVYVCPWSNTVNADGLAGQRCRFICTQLFAWRVSKKSATIANYLRRLLVRVYPKLNLGRVLAVLSFSGEIYQGRLDFFKQIGHIKRTKSDTRSLLHKLSQPFITMILY